MKRPAFLPDLSPTLLAALLLLPSSLFARGDRTLAGGRVHAAVISDGRLFTMGKNDNGALGIGSDTSYVASPVLVSTGWRHVTASAYSTFGIKTDSTLWAWGTGNSGELGQGSTAHSKTPLQVGGDKWITVSANTQGYSILAIRSDSTLWGWGRNHVGQLGDSTTQARLSPVQIGTARWLDVDAGEYHSLGIRADSTLWAWGDNASGNLGDGTTDAQLAPVQIGTAKWRTVSAAGGSHSHGIQSDGTLWGWGRNTDYALGFTNNPASVLVPTQVGTDLWLSLDAHTKYVGAIRSDSTLWFWGSNRYDAAFGLEQRGVDSSSTPIQMRSGKWTEVALGSENQTSFGRTASGLYYGWGNSEDGQSGTGEGNFDTPRLILKASQTITFAALPSKAPSDADFAPGATASSGLTVAYASSDPTVATIVSGQIHIVGVGTATITASQAGNDTYDAAPDATRILTVALPPHPHVDRKVAALYEGSIVIREGVGLYAAGNNNVYQLGLGDQTSRNSLHLIAPGNWRHVDAAERHALALKEDSTLWAWGYLPYGGFGDGSTQHTVPAQIGSSRWITVATGVGCINFGIQADSSLWAWGANDFSAYGDGTAVTRSTLTRIGSDRWLDVSSMQTHALGIQEDGSLWSWGTDEYDILGNGNLNEVVPTPTRIGSDTWRMVSAGYHSSFAIRSDSTLWAWGGNNEGSTGLGTTAGTTPTPTQVGADKWIWVDAGMNYATLGLKADSTLWTWGTNQSGYIAQGASANALQPTQVGTGKWRQATLGESHGMGQTAAGEFYGWGFNNYGALGDSSNSNRTTPALAKWSRAQAIAFPALAAKYLGDADFAPGATVSTGFAITYASSDPSVATIVSGQIHLVGAGTTTITASVAGSADFDPAESSRSLTVIVMAAQTITFPPLPASKTWLDADFLPGATASSGLTVSYSSSDTAVARIVSGKIRPVSAGTATITASQAGNAYYHPAVSETRTVTFSHPPHPHQDRKVSAGTSATFAIVDSVGLYGAGWGASYRLGLGSTENRNRFQLVAPGNWRHVDFGNTHALALKDDSTLWGWGTFSPGWGDGTTLHTTPVQIGTAKWIKVTAGNSFATNYGIRADSTLWVWGAYSSGNHGNGSVANTSSFAQIGEAKWVDVAAYSNWVYAIRSDRTLWSWGSGVSGVLGNGASSGTVSTPTQIGSARWSMVASGSSFGLGIRTDSTLWSWGSNLSGATGQGTTAGNTLSPAQVGAAKWIWVEGGSSVSAGVRADSTFWSWGSGSSMGLDSGVTQATVPTQVGSAKWRQASIGSLAGVGLSVSGAVYGWGLNTYGAVGDSTTTARYTPTLSQFNRTQTLTFPTFAAKTYGDADFAPGAASDAGNAITYASSDTTVASIVSGQIHIVGAGTTIITASAAGSTVYDARDSSQVLTVAQASQTLSFTAPAARSMGDADFDPGATASSGLAVTYASSDTTVATVVSGQIHIVGAGTAVITASQAGNANYLAAPDSSHTLTVSKLPQSLTFAALPSGKTWIEADFAPGATASSGLAVSYASSDTTVATIVSGSIHPVGAGTTTITASQAGNGMYDSAASVTRSLTLADLPHPHVDRKVSVGGSAALAIVDGVGLYGTGAGDGYRLGLGDDTARNRFALISEGSWRHVDFGDQHGLAIKGDSTLWGWGTNPYGWGDGTTLHATPFQIGTARWIKVSAGIITATNYGIRADSTLWVWGAYSSGNHGNGSTSSTSTPAQIGTAKWVDVAAMGNAVYAVKADRTLWTWGSALSGKLGNGATTGTVSTPTQVGTARWIRVAAAVQQGFAIRSDSTLWSWGLNSSAVTGLGTTSGTTSTPTQVGTAKWIGVDGGSGGAVGIQSDSTFWSWGVNTQGILAQGSSGVLTTPTQVGTAKWRQVALGLASGMGLRDSGAYYGWGANSYGAVGDSSNTDRTAPTLARFNRTQALAFPAFAAKTYGDADFAPGASTDAGTAITYASSDTTVATLVSGQIRIVGAGTTTITASAAGNAAFDSRDSSQTLTVARAAQSIAFPAPAAKSIGDADFALGATASSGLAVSYASSDTTVAAIVSGQVRIVGAGTAVLTASQAGNANYQAAPDSSHTLKVSKLPQSITFAALAAKTFGDGAFALGATASSGLAVAYSSSDTTVATVSGSTVTVVGAGSADITARQAGNATYDSAAAVTRTLTVGKASQSIAFPALAAKTLGDADFAPGATASSGLPVSYASSDTTVATLVGGQIHLVGAGTATITASQSGDGNYLAASDTAQVLSVGKVAQTLTFAALTARTYGDSAFTLGATATSGLPVAYASSDTTVARVSGSTVTVIGAGTATLTASQAGDATYLPAADVARSLTVDKAAQAITFAAPGSKALGDADFAPGASASSGLPVSYASSDTTVASIVAGQVHLVGSGTVTLTASQAGDGNYAAASDVTQSLTIGKASQSITFAALSGRTYGDSAFTLGATAGSGLSVSYASSNTAVATVSGSTVTVVGAGTADITATQAGNGIYLAATAVVRTLIVNKANQTLSFPAIAGKTLGDADFAPGATATSGLAVTYSSSDTTVATIVSGQIHLVGAGTVTITASQPGNGNYEPAVDVSRSLTVGNTSQTLAFSALPAKTYGDSAFALAATASSGLAVSYASSNPAVATVSGSTVTVVGAGSTDITASQAGNSTYLAAVDVVQTLTVNKAAQSISFSALGAKTLGEADFAPGATATSGLTVSYASSDTTVATIVSGQIHLVGAGTTILTASQAGDGNHHAAADISQSLTVGKTAQAITFAALSDRIFGESAFALGGTASSGLTVSYTSSNPAVATVSGFTVTVVGAGTAEITASQAGNGAYLAAADVVQTLTVNKAAQSISFSALGAKSLGEADFAPGATASSGLSIAYSSSDTTVATLVSGQIHLVGAGTATITATQPGNAHYHAAAPVTQSLSVGKIAQAITFPSLPDRTFGDSAFTLAASAGSGLPLTYASSNPAVATVSGSTVTVVGAGTTSITASQAGDAAHLAAADAVQTLTVHKAGQSLAFPALPGKTLGEADFAPGATVTSGLPIAYGSSDTAVAEIVAGQVRLKGAGTTAITASQAGSADYLAAADVVRTLTVGKASQTLAFTAPAAKTFGDPAFPLEAAASSGLPVAFASSDTAVATVSGSTVTVVGAGTAVLTASQAGQGAYLAAPAVSHTLTVDKAGQAITFPTLPAKTLGEADFAPGASASSGLDVTYASSDTTVATLVGGKVRLVGAGTATLTASQPGDGNHLAAPDALRTLTVDKRAQTLVFAALAPRTFGDSAFAPGATASSGLPVSYASSNPEVATVVDGLVHLKGSGTTTVTASQAGDGAHHAAPPVEQLLTVGKAAHALAFSLGADTLKTVGDAPFRLGAVSNAGLPVGYTSSDTAVAQVHGDSVKVGRAGTAEITALQAGNHQYAAAGPVTRTLRVRVAAPLALSLESLTPRAEAAADTQVVLAWPRREGAEGYRVQAQLDPSGTTLADRNVQDTSIPLGGLAFGAQVRWRVAPFNATGEAPFSPYAAFQVRPAPPKPLDVARIPTYSEAGTGTTVELTWPKADEATAYRIQVYLDTARPPYVDTLVETPSFTLRELPPGSRQIWRVAPMNGVSQAPFTPWLTFQVRDKETETVTKGHVVDSAKAVQVSSLVAIAPKDSATRDVVLTLTEDKRAPANLPAGFLPLTGNISLLATSGSGRVDDSLLTITLSPPDTALDGSPVAAADQPLVYTLDSATGRLEVVYDLPRDSAGRIVLPLSKGKSFLLAVDTVPPVVKDSSSPAPRAAGSTGLVISGVVEDNIRNSRTLLRFRRGGSESFDSLPVAIDAEGRFALPLDLALDSTGFEYSITATDGRNVKATPAANVPVEVKALKAADSLPSMQWRLFALPTLPKETRWEDLAPSLGTYGTDWKLFARTADGLTEFGPALAKAEAGVAYWLKSRKRGLRPAIAGGVVAPVNKPFTVVVPPKTWLSFGNPFLFPVAWQSVLDSTRAAPGALAGPYTFRDTAWVTPLEIPVLLPWEGYYAYNASDDTLRLRIPARKAKDHPLPIAQAAFRLEWQVRGADGKDAGNHFGGLATLAPAPLAKASASAAPGAPPTAASPLWHAPKPEGPEDGLRAGFLSAAGGAGLLQTDFRAVAPQGGLTWSARLSGLKPGRTYANRLQGFDALPGGLAVAVADPATGRFVPWSAGMIYEVEAQAGEDSRELLFYAGTPEYVRSRGADFQALHPFAAELRNHPNPIRTYTVVDFAVPASAAGRQRIRLSVYDMQGRLVKVLKSGPMPTGRHSLRWDLRDEGGRAVAAGSYRLLLKAGNRTLHRPLQVLP